MIAYTGGSSSAANAQEMLAKRLKSKNIGEQFKAFAIKHNPQSQEDVEKLKKQFIARIRAEVEKQAAKQVQPGLKEKALLELIGDKLKLQEARRLDMVVDDEELEQVLKGIAQNNGRSLEEFFASLEQDGIKRGTMRERIRAQVSWSRVLGRRFRGQVSVGQGEIDNALEVGPAAASLKELVELQVQRITIGAPGKIDQAVMAERYATAETVRSRISGCANMAAAAKGVPGARFENLGKVGLDDLSSEVRPILAQASEGDVPPPIFSASGIELYAVCGKTIGTKSEGARTAARQKIEDEKMRALSKGLLNDLCAGAYIEFRGELKPQKRCDIE